MNEFSKEMKNVGRRFMIENEMNDDLELHRI